MSDRIHVRGGIPIEFGAAPGPGIGALLRPGAVALLGADLHGLRPKLLVNEGDHVALGQPLFRDRARPSIIFAAPMAGRVLAIEMGARRRLSALVIRADGEVEAPSPGPLDAPDGAVVRRHLLERGLWPAFVSRPFGTIPDPGAVPDAIVVTALDTAPLAPDPRPVVDADREDFRTGLGILEHLTAGPVHLCQDGGAPLAEETGRLRLHHVTGRHPAGLAGSLVHRLHPVGSGAQVWTVGYQDVIAIGHLFATGRYRADRVVSVAGPRVATPRLVRTILGAHLADLTEGQLTDRGRRHPAQVLSGPPVGGRPAAYLHRHDRQVSVVDGAAKAPDLAIAVWLRRHLPHRQVQAVRPLFPAQALDAALGLDLLAVPLMRALATGDDEAARALGALELIEEDVALLSALCTSGADYGALLRGTLDRIAHDEGAAAA